MINANAIIEDRFKSDQILLAESISTKQTSKCWNMRVHYNTI